MRRVASVQQFGHETLEAGDGAATIEVHKQQSTRAVLMDITMPNMDRLAALKEIMASDPQVQVAMVTAMGQHGMADGTAGSGDGGDQGGGGRLRRQPVRTRPRWTSSQVDAARTCA